MYCLTFEISHFLYGAVAMHIILHNLKTERSCSSEEQKRYYLYQKAKRVKEK